MAAAAEMIAAQARHVAELRASGILALEVLPHHLSAELINEYVAVSGPEGAGASVA